MISKAHKGDELWESHRDCHLPCRSTVIKYGFGMALYLRIFAQQDMCILESSGKDRMFRLHSLASSLENHFSHLYARRPHWSLLDYSPSECQRPRPTIDRKLSRLNADNDSGSMDSVAVPPGRAFPLLHLDGPLGYAPTNHHLMDGSMTQLVTCAPRAPSSSKAA
ncbi:hypothetical protein P691DRAFT_598965 [Macrolepiota fuliginosa MF-IS2]|uniref:Uncharacterized protein n=1 Tax=Macrolepiota fuliginosa MF-IS2 TaxID=1400762 RepID=A0A9P6C1T8_9AGAR|nr:hypothetical protein P691DRAFT_598965 [Macrolepiota fuliginosa MF-IS2]